MGFGVNRLRDAGDAGYKPALPEKLLPTAGALGQVGHSNAVM